MSSNINPMKFILVGPIMKLKFVKQYYFVICVVSLAYGHQIYTFVLTGLVEAASGFEEVLELKIE